MRRGRSGTSEVPAGARPLTLWTPDGVRLAALLHEPATPAPGRPSCVVVHGFTGTSRNPDVLRISRALAARGFTVLAPDLRGHGDSGGGTTAGADEVHDVAAAVAWLRDAGFGEVATLGWSMGGSSVLRHAGLGGDTDAVVSVSAAGTWWERGTRPMRLVHWTFEHRIGRVVVRTLRNTRVAANVWDDIPEAPAEVAGAIAPRPLLIVHGDADSYFPMAHVEALAAAAPTATVWREPGMGHAESGTGTDLLDRIGTWVLTALRSAASGDDASGGAASDGAADRQVCDDGRRVDDGND